MSKLPIYLIGFMASGKSKIGRKLAKKLDVDFIDLDQIIEEEEGMSINEIFNEKGEEGFRQIEKFALHTTKDKKAVVALGGGTVCYFDNMNFVKENGTSIYLNVRPEVLFGRLKVNKNNRPLVKQLSDEELKVFINQKLAEREIYYKLADCILTDDNPSLKKLIRILN